MELHELIQRVRSYTNIDVESPLRTAYQIASDAHKGFKRQTGEPYIDHSMAVANILAEWQAPPEVVAAGLLHNIFSPNYAHGYNLPSVRKMLDPKIFRLLDALSHLNSFIHRFDEDYSGVHDAAHSRDVNVNFILHEVGSFIQGQDVFVIKIADRLYNLQTLSALPGERQKKIANRGLHIFAPLADRLGMGKVKEQLEDLCFKIINPIFYDLLKQHRTDSTFEEAVKGGLNGLQNTLAPLQLKTKVMWQSFSLWTMYHRQIEKNARHGKFFHEGPLSLQLEDSGAFIILTETQSDCFRLFGEIHAHYHPVEREFHDYIANPKENGYRSLHTQVRFSTGHLINIIIRTYTMDLLAKHGYTAAWQGLSEELLPHLPTAAKHGENEIRLFTPTGEARYLPQGATPIDFAYDIHTDMGDHCLGAQVNGKRIDLYQALQNDDIVEIITAAEAQPSPDWLKHVITHHAINRIRHWLIQQNRHAMEEQGRTLLDRELFPLQLSSTDSEVSRLLTHLAQLENLEGPEDMLVAIGVGRWKASKFVERLRLMRSSHYIEPASNINVLDPEAAPLPRDFARCCQPMPPHEIVGYMRNNRVLIHRRTCPRIKKVKKLVEAQWEITPPEPDYVIVVESLNRAGLAADLSHVITMLGIDMQRFDSRQHSDGSMAETFIYLGPTTSLQRSRIQTALEAEAYVKRVEALHTSGLSATYIPNPYGPNPAVGPRFYGRDRETQRIMSQLQDQTQNSIILLSGQKRIGKTSLVLRLEEHSGGDFHPVYLDMEGLAYCTTLQFLYQLIHRIFQQLKASIPDPVHAITIPHFNRFKQDPLGLFDMFIARIQDAVQYQPVALILDEFQYLCSLHEETVSRTDIFNNLRSLTQHGHAFHMILSGNGLLSTFLEQPGLASLLATCYEERLGRLGEAAASHLIKDGLSRLREVEEEAVNFLYNITAGHPYYLQLLCYQLHERAQEDDSAITYALASQTIDDWLAKPEESPFVHLWTGDNRTEAQRNKVILSAIAQYGTDYHEITYDRLCKAICPFIEEPDLVHSLDDLTYMGIVKHDQLNYAIEVDLFARWLQKHWPLTLVLKEAGLS